MMIKRKLKYILTFLGLLPLVEKINFNFKKFQYKNINAQFLKENPTVILPPDFYMYETFGLNYSSFYCESIDTAKWIIAHFGEYEEIKHKHILDWGCGAGRVIRHLPKLIDSTNRVYGTDYNEKYVKWCGKNLDNVEIRSNHLNPPLPFEADFFDLIYSISIFTHLSEKMHSRWMTELNRVSKIGAKILITVHGDCFKIKLSKGERELFNNGNIIVHSYKKEGNRLFAAYQPPTFFKKLVVKKGFKIVKHIEGKVRNNKPQQDVWILEKISKSLP